MASKTISTRLVIEGESEYKQSVLNINSALGVLKSELSAVKAEYSANANGMDALKAKAEVMSKLHDAQAGKLKAVAEALENARRGQQEYAAKVEEANQKVQAAEQRLESMTGKSNRAVRARNELTASLEEYRKELSQAEKYNEAAQRGVNSWEKQLNNAKKDLFNLNQEIQKNDQYLSEAKKSTDGCATSIDAYGKKVKGSKEQIVDSSAAISALAGALAAGGLKVAFDEVTAAITGCIDASVRFETAITGVYKTVNGSQAQLEGISQGIREMALAIPASTTEIASVAEAAGQLGIATEDILDFTRVMVDLGNATNLSADEAATAFARFANITGMSAENYERLGSSVVALGNNFATTESEITAMATRLAAAGSISGLTEPEIMAVATALSSVGIEAEAGGSAISRLMKEFEVMVVTGSDKLSGFASVAGMSAQQFSQAWKADAVGALSQFISGLGRLDAAGGSSVATLEELGVTETRMSDAVLRLAGSGDLLSRAVETSNQAWVENKALTDEVSKRYETTESKLAILNNAFQELKISVGDVFAPAVRDAAEGGADLLMWAADVVEKCPAVVGVISAVVAALGVLTLAVTAYSIAVNIIIPLLEAFNTAIKGNPVGLAAVAIATAVAALGAFCVVMKGATEETRGWSNSTKEAVSTWKAQREELEASAASTGKMVAALRELSDKEQKSAADKQAILGLVRDLNEAVPELNLAYDEQTDSLNMTTEALERMIVAQREQARVENTQGALAKLYTDQLDLVDQMEAAQKRLADAERGFAELDGVEKKNTRQQMSYDGYKDAIVMAEMEIQRLTGEQAANEEQIQVLEGDYNKLTTSVDGTARATNTATIALVDFNSVLGKLQGGYELLAKAQKEQSDKGSLSVSTVTTLMEKYPQLMQYLVETADGYRLTDGALQDYIATQRAEYQLAYDNASSAAQSVVDAEIKKRGAIIDTTLSIKEQLKALIVFYGAAVDAMASASGVGSDIDSQRAEQLAARKTQSLQEQLDRIEAAEKNLGTFDRTSSMLGRDNSSSGSKGSSKKAKTPAELELEAYREAVKELDHLRAMEDITDEEYYRRKEKAGAQYLQNNLEESRKLEEELYSYHQGAYDRDLAELDKALKYKEITHEEHAAQVAALQSKHLTEGSDAWKESDALQAQDRQNAYEEKLAALDQALEDEKISYEQHYEGLQALAGEAQALGEDAQRDHQKRMEQNRKSAYDEEMADQKYFLDMGIISEEEYYRELERARDEFLEKDSDEWRRANVELKQYQDRVYKEALATLKEALDEKLDALKDSYDEEKTAIKDGYDAEKEALKEGYDAQKKAAKEAYEAKKDAIKKELDLEKERLNGILEGIDAEIQARRELREDEDLDGAIAAAQKRLDAAKAQMEFARTDEDKRQWSDEIIRLEKALQEAVQKKEDTEFYREKELEKEGIRDQLDAAQKEADGKLDSVAKDYEAATSRLEAEYNASVKRLEADYAAKLAQAEARYKEAVKELEDRYESAKSNVGSGGSSKDDRYNQKEWSDEVRAISREKGVDLGVAQDMYNMDQRHKDDPNYKPYSSGGYEKAAKAAAGAMGAAMAGLATVVGATVANQVTRNNSANVVINQASALTSGQIGAAVRKAVEAMDR